MPSKENPKVDVEIELPSSEWKQIRKLAKKDGITLDEWVAKAIAEWIKRNNK